MTLKSSINTLLCDYVGDESKDKDSIEKEIWNQYGRSGAVLIMDMSGFSRTSLTKGLVFYLSMVHRMQVLVNPILSRMGCLVKFEADNAFAFFETTEDAISAALMMQESLNKENSKNPDDMDIQISVGIDYGEFLYLPEVPDFFGNPVNFACKLGEDIGEAGEILITETAWNMMQDHPFEGKLGAYQVSGIAFKAYKLYY